MQCKPVGKHCAMHKENKTNPPSSLSPSPFTSQCPDLYTGARGAKEDGTTTSHPVPFPLFYNHPYLSISPSTSPFLDLQYTRHKRSRSKRELRQNLVETYVGIRCFSLQPKKVPPDVSDSASDNPEEFLVLEFFLILRIPLIWDWFLLCLLESTSLQEHTGSDLHDLKWCDA
ncbi:hypothetical protein Cgig2_006521 [Carnegiea gigantea]|uniref:Uncharacterized protein n=1 Tax=Carnegiea gigantea TaxID=171969 RepID=A0A9Q1GXD1_9CARY|nr:hypothetical protein Cgig2_006521 [Carnegiea gigantea]